MSRVAVSYDIFVVANNRLALKGQNIKSATISDGEQKLFHLNNFIFLVAESFLFRRLKQPRLPPQGLDVVLPHHQLLLQLRHLHLVLG